MSVTLDNCFENSQDKEILNRANQIFCNNYKQVSDASTQNKMFTCPEVMTIILNGGKELEFEVNFEYPLFINIDEYITNKSSLGNFKYELICVLTHFGPSGMSGHFITFCKSPVDDISIVIMIQEFQNVKIQDMKIMEILKVFHMFYFTKMW